MTYILIVTLVSQWISQRGEGKSYRDVTHLTILTAATAAAYLTDVQGSRSETLPRTMNTCTLFDPI